MVDYDAPNVLHDRFHIRRKAAVPKTAPLETFNLPNMEKISIVENMPNPAEISL